MSKKAKKLKTLEDLKVANYGKRGMKKREDLEEGYKVFKFGYLIREARLKKGMTQQELADKVGTTKSYISKIENNIKEARISTLQNIIETGFGGTLEMRIRI